ncbi:hypothetical protein J7J59_02605 [Candidatus Aerophobetes bacterium]|nr:hypothetical protein [Candidatus Aerophobetes bacterium]
MAKYIVRTGKGRTFLFLVKRKNELIGHIDYDFILRGGILPVRSKIMACGKIAGWVETFYPSISCIRVYNKRREEVAYLERSNRLRIDGVYVSFNRLSKEETILVEEREGRGKLKERLEKTGLTHSYLLEDSKIKGRVYCFARESDISTLLYISTDIEAGIDELLRFLPLAIARRVFEQEFIRRFMGR